MRRLSLAAVVMALSLAVPTVARAGWIVEGSIGKGAKVSPSPVKAEQLNLMVSPGLTLFDSILRLQVGLLSELPDVEASKFNLEFRPMITISPPLLPIYARAVFGITNLLSGETTVAYGGAVGLSIGVGPIGVFAEAGFLPRSRMSQINWVIEGRLGVSVGF